MALGGAQKWEIKRQALCGREADARVRADRSAQKTGSTLPSMHRLAAASSAKFIQECVTASFNVRNSVLFVTLLSRNVRDVGGALPLASENNNDEGHIASRGALQAA